jgi:hypothetical protein
LLLAAGALWLFYALLLPKPVASDGERSEPLSTDRGSDGELALWRWLQAEHIPESSLRYRYDHLLPGPGVPPKGGAPVSTGNVLITMLPHKNSLRAGELEAIRQWTSAGNTVLILAALDDTPMWSIGIDERLLPELTALTGMGFSVIGRPRARSSPENDSPPADLKQLLGSADIRLEPRGEHPLLDQVHIVQANSPLPSARWQANPNGALPLILLRRRDSGAPALWLLRFGKGQVILSSFASLFTNAQIDQHDNAQLLANIIHWSRADQGSVIFDDVHQGLTDYYDPHAFFADPRLHRTLAWVLLLWLAFVLGPLPLRAAYVLWRPVDETALVEASGRFYSAAVAPLEAAQRLFENFFNRQRRRLHLPENGAPLWDWLRTQGRLSEPQCAQLENFFEKVQAGKRVKLTQLQRLLAEIQGTIA